MQEKARCVAEYRRGVRRGGGRAARCLAPRRGGEGAARGLAPRRGGGRATRGLALLAWMAMAWAAMAWTGCAPAHRRPAGAAGPEPPHMAGRPPAAAPEADVIIDTRTGEPVSFEAMMDDLADVRVVFIGERHTSAAHHEIQLRIIKALYERHPRDLKVGMEMFSRPYQSVLDDWSAGLLDRSRFLRRVHWHANWKYDFDLYAGILEFAREASIPVVALNIPFHIPPKIAVGGIDTLLPEEAAQLPRSIDTQNAAHRAYLKEIYERHRAMLRGRDDFEDFYMVQNVWEDVMAEAVADNLGDGCMAVALGNGHIVNRYGVPDRMAARTGLPYRTVLPDPGGDVVPGPAVGDYIWRTAGPDQETSGPHPKTAGPDQETVEPHPKTSGPDPKTAESDS